MLLLSLMDVFEGGRAYGLLSSIIECLSKGCEEVLRALGLV
jgi:hypothetical protein